MNCLKGIASFQLNRVCSNRLVKSVKIFATQCICTNIPTIVKEQELKVMLSQTDIAATGHEQNSIHVTEKKICDRPKYCF